MTDTPQATQFAINAQYIKDLSFENPNSPQSLVGQKGQPDIKVMVDVGIRRLQESNFEVSLIMSATSQLGQDVMFVVELTYAGVFTVSVPEQELEPLLMVYCPGLLFPFARRILSDAVRDGGFQPLMLDPIDFGALYQRHRQQVQEQEGQQNPEAEVVAKTTKRKAAPAKKK